MLYKPNIILYHSNVKNKIDKKYDDEFKDLLRYYKKYTKKLFNEFDCKKEKLIQDIDNECNIKYLNYINTTMIHILCFMIYMMNHISMIVYYTKFIMK